MAIPKFYSCSCHLCGIHCDSITSKSALNSVLPNSISHSLFSAALWPSVSHYLLFLPLNVISVSFPTYNRACTRICIIYQLIQNLKKRRKQQQITWESMLYKVLFLKTSTFIAEITERLHCTKIQCTGYQSEVTQFIHSLATKRTSSILN